MEAKIKICLETFNIIIIIIMTIIVIYNNIVIYNIIIITIIAIRIYICNICRTCSGSNKRFYYL